MNSVVNTTKKNGWANVQLPFVLGILLAALGGYLVTKHAPKPGPPAEAKASPTP